MNRQDLLKKAHELLEKQAIFGLFSRPAAKATVRKGASKVVGSTPHGSAGSKTQAAKSYDWSNELHSSGGHRHTKAAGLKSLAVSTNTLLKATDAARKGKMAVGKYGNDALKVGQLTKVASILAGLRRAASVGKDVAKDVVTKAHGLSASSFGNNINQFAKTTFNSKPGRATFDSFKSGSDFKRLRMIMKNKNPSAPGSNKMNALKYKELRRQQIRDRVKLGLGIGTAAAAYKGLKGENTQSEVNSYYYG